MSRERNGRFAKGNPGGPGNPGVRRLGEYQRVLREVVTPERLGHVLQTLLERAAEGDVAAIKLLFDRVLGRPREETVEIPAVTGPMESLADLPEALKRTMAALRRGEVTAAEVALVARVVREFCSAMEFADFDAQLTELRQLIESQGGGT